MKFNNKWTKDINDKYRNMIKNGLSMDNIRKQLGYLMKYHPDGKFNKIFSFNKYNNHLNEIKFNPNYIYFEFNYIPSQRYKDKKDIICYFTINKIKYVLLLEYLIENNNILNNEIVYNIFFTTLKQYNEYIEKISEIDDIIDKEKEFYNFQNIIEKETNIGDIIKIFNGISYILLNIINFLDNKIYMISDTTNSKKIQFYLKSIKDSFEDKFEFFKDKSLYAEGNSYYFVNKKNI